MHAYAVAALQFLPISGYGEPMPWQVLKEAMGAAPGRSFRSVLSAVSAGLGRLWPAPAPQSSAKFTMAIVALAAKLSKADGVSMRIEAEAFERMYRVPDEELSNVKHLFDLAKQDVAGFESYALQIADMLRDEPSLKREVLEGLFYIASADGIIHEAEEAYLRRVAELFGIGADDFRRTRALFVRDEEDPYVLLGLPHDAAPDDIKAHYRKLVREHHPDTAIANGVPKEFVEQATRKLAAINAAYEIIARERGL